MLFTLMRNTLYLPIVLLFTGLLCMGTQCHKDEIEFQYHFIEKINLVPAQKSYNIGDTIWLQYSNPTKRLYDNKTSQLISADTVAIGFLIGFNSRYDAPVNPTGGFCDFVSASGTTFNIHYDVYGTSALFGFGCNSNNNYNFSIGIIPRQKGIYSLDLWGAPRSVTGRPNRISYFPLSTIAYRFNIADCNKDIYLEIPTNSRGDSPKRYTESEIDKKEVYIVKVE